MVVEVAKAGIDAAVAGGMHTAGIGEASAYNKTEFAIHRFGELLSL